MRTIGYNEFLQAAMRGARQTDTPISGSFELTPLCNLDCRMCYVHLTDPTVRERMLSGDEWVDLMGQAIGHGMMRALLTGGEAMTHPDFERIYMYLIEQGISVRIKTNGILLDEKAIDLFAEYPPYVVDVSLYGCDGQSYVAVTGHDVFEVVTANVRAAVAAGLHVHLKITPSAQMMPWVDEVMEYARTLGAEDVSVNAMLMEANPGTGRSMGDFGLTLEENARIHRRQRELFPRAPRTQDEEEAELMGPVPKDEPHILPRGLYCNGGRTAFAVNWDGTMGPCLSFPRDVVCADARGIGFERAWREVNRAVKDYAVPEECHACSHNTRCHYCPAQHRSLAARHLCVAESCDWRKLQADIADEWRAKTEK